MSSNDPLRAALQSQLGGDNASASSRKAPPFFSRASDEDLASFYRMFAVLIGAGFPLAKSLGVLNTTIQNKDLSATAGQLAATLESGRPLHTAMREFPWYFPASHSAVIRAAHESGSLGDALEYLADSVEHQQEVRGKLSSAISYPAIVIVLGFSAMLVMLFFVIPTFESSLATANLPEREGVAALAFGLSDFVRTPYGVPLMLSIIAAGAFGLWRWRQTRRADSDRLLGRLPIIGRLFLLAHTSQFVDILHMLLKHGIPLAQALPLAAEGVNNAYLRIALEASVAEVAAGRSMVNSLRGYHNLPPVFLELLALGETAGQLPRTLEHLSRFLRARMNSSVERFSVLLQPIVLVVGGVIVTAVVMTFFNTYFEVLMDLTKVGVDPGSSTGD
jgi:type II secretory pathway component PulF